MAHRTNQVIRLLTIVSVVLLCSAFESGPTAALESGPI